MTMQSTKEVSIHRKRFNKVIWECFQYLHIFGVFILMINVIYRFYHFLIDFHLNHSPTTTEELHSLKVKRVQDQVKRWRRSGSKKTMCTARPKTHSVMMSQPNYRDTLHAIDMNDLNQIIRIDTHKMVVKVEPLVCMGQLMDYLLPLGWTIPIVPEIEALTVGGLIMGGGLQSSSHKFGMFHRTCKSFEMVMSNGELLRCTKYENADLFHCIPITYGTVGLLAAVEIDIIKGSNFVKVDYYPAHTYREGLELMERYSHDKSNNFVEPILFSQKELVVMIGNLVDTAPQHKVNRVVRWYKPWFYKHVESHLESGEGQDFIPLRDYYFRHARCLFWHSAPFVPYGNHPLFRYLLGWTLPINIRMLKTIQPKAANMKMFVQDYLVKAEAIVDIVTEAELLSRFYPIWFCPVNCENDKTLLMRHRQGEMKARGNFMIYDVGFYGFPSYKRFHAPSTTRKLEEITMKHKGIRGLYTDTYMTREELTEMFNLKEYQVLRKKYDAEGAFPDICAKVSMKARVEGL